MRSSRLAVIVAALVASACSRDHASPAPAGSAPGARAASASIAAAVAAPAPKHARPRPKTDAELPTTSGEIYLGNVDGQIEEFERLLKLDPKSAYKLQSLSDLLHTRGKQRGDLDEIQRGIALLERAIAIEPEKAALYVDHADQVQSLHRFGEARADLDKAKAKGATDAQLAPLRQELDWNAGNYAAAIPAIRAAVAAKKTMWTVARVAQLHHDLGEAEQADLAFDEAEDLVTDTNPLPVAWLDVQRGLHKVSTGQLEAAVLDFREAARRIPTWTTANEHLAETLHMLGKDDEAAAIYEQVVARSDDPEFKGALAGVYRAKGRTKEADALRAKAIAGYERLLAKYPEAMYWHASEFFMEEGRDPKKALELLRKNLALRPNSGSYVALARAELANGKVDDARKSIDAALAMPVKSGELFWTAARVYARSKEPGEAAKSADFAAKAKAFNPRIDQKEPPIGAR